nr:protein phosphatase 1 regulatory subunit 15A [Misgurnus anguillicaudatus]
MAPFIFHPHRPLSYQCRLPLPALYKQTKMTSELSLSTPETHQDLPLSPYHPTSILLKIRLHLWQIIRRVINCCACVTELFSSNMFFFICVGKNIAMTGELKKGTAEAQERPGWEFTSGSMGLVNFDEEMKDTEMKVMEMDELAKPAEMMDLSVIDSDDEEEEEDEARLSEWESDEETDDDDSNDEEEEEEEGGEDNEEQPHDNDDEDSEWSDDEDGDSEGSAESFELWESFFNSSDPYNPLSFSCSTGSKTNTTNKNQLTASLQIKQTKSTPATKAEEQYPKPSTKEGGKKVCFSDKVTVRPLVAWSFASRAARDGSCWMQMARDRERFRRRVKSIESIIEPCLTPEHRAGIWKRLHNTPA